MLRLKIDMLKMTELSVDVHVKNCFYLFFLCGQDTYHWPLIPVFLAITTGCMLPLHEG